MNLTGAKALGSIMIVVTVRGLPSRHASLDSIPNWRSIMGVKKAYVELVAYLEANKDSKVKTILAGAIELCSAKSGGAGGAGANFKKDDKGKVTHVFCYYHKMWEDVNEVAFGVKSTSPTGLNNMCKEGTSQWTKQHRASKKANEDLLNDVSEGKVDPKDLKGLRADIEASRAIVVPREDKQGVKDLK